MMTSKASHITNAAQMKVLDPVEGEYPDLPTLKKTKLLLHLHGQHQPWVDL